MFKLIMIAVVVVSGLMYFGVLGDVGEFVTEMLPEAAQRYSPSDAESDSRSPPQSPLSLSTPSFGQKEREAYYKGTAPSVHDGLGAWRAR